METTPSVERIEATFRFRLPEAYRRFLIEQQGDVDASIEIDVLESWPRGKTATVDGIYSADSILKNDASDASCDLEQQMLIIGYSVVGGYLYLCWNSLRFGQIFFRAPFLDPSFCRVADSFEDFLARSRPISYDDEA